MIETTRLRMMFQVYLEAGTMSDAVEMAAHIPALLDVIDAQQGLIEKSARMVYEHLTKLDELKEIR